MKVIVAAAKPRALVISGFLCSPDTPSGGQQLVWDQVHTLSESYDITLICFRNQHERLYGDFSTVRSKWRVCIVDIRFIHRLLGALVFPFSPLVSSPRRYLLWRLSRRQFSCESFAHLHVEFIQAAEAIRYFDRVESSAIVVHDLLDEALERRSNRYGFLVRLLLRIEAARTRPWQSEIVSRFASIATLTLRDRDRLSRSLSGRKIDVRYPSRQLSPTFLRSKQTVSRGMILFFGQMSRFENEDAVVWFTSSVLPIIRERLPFVRLVVAGANPTEVVKKLSSDYVSVSGFVDSVLPLFAEAHVAVAPLRFGSGIKIKVVEYLTAGIPTVATSVGAEGIQPNELLHICDDPIAFADACIRQIEA